VHGHGLASLQQLPARVQGLRAGYVQFIRAVLHDLANRLRAIDGFYDHGNVQAPECDQVQTGH